MIEKIFIKGIEKAGSQAKLGELLGVPQQHISSFKRVTKESKRKPTDEVILKIADFLELDKREVLYKAKLELEPEKADLWRFLIEDGAPGGNRTHDPRLRRVGAVNYFIQLIQTIIILTVVRHQRTEHNLNEHNALYYQYRHGLTNL